MMQNGGSVAGEPLQLFRQAAALDPKHVRSRFYIAGEETRTGDYADGRARVERRSWRWARATSRGW